jgi:hypothetical protein
MSDDSFVSRWSRLKRESAQRETAPSKASDARPSEPPDARAGEASGGTQPKREPPFDPATLPPLDSIVAGSDIRAFLEKGVPAELTKAALRRAWIADPAIRDFIGLAENQWDFTDPTGVPGFGPLKDADGLRQLVGQAMCESSDAGAVALSRDSDAGSGDQAAASTPAATHAAPATGPQPDDGPGDQEGEAGPTASQHPADGRRAVEAGRRGHGRALPR